MRYIVLDFECQDFWIKAGRGAGWPEKQAEFLCASTLEGDTCTYYTNINLLIKDLSHDNITIISHNASYEAGVLLSYGFDIEGVTWIDTVILAKLHNNDMISFGLDALSKFYQGTEKNDDALGDVAISLGLVKSKVQNPVKIAKENMGKVFAARPDLVELYVKQDVKLCYDLYKLFMEKNSLTQEQIDFHSDLIKATVLSRAEGIRANTNTAQQLKNKFNRELIILNEQIQLLAPGININSGKQLAEFFTREHVPFELTEKGNPSITTEWLASIDHPIAKHITRAKMLGKLVNDFIEPVLALKKGDEEYVRVYPELKIYGAAQTGRASCSNPNFQQIPSRTPEGQMIRTIYEPEEGDSWFSLDYSAQEPRMQIHFGAKLGDKSALKLIEEFKKDKTKDVHHAVACLIHGRNVDAKGAERKEAKTINLGLSYGMGIPKLAESLGLTRYKAGALLRKFNAMAPYIALTTTYVTQVAIQRKQIKLIDGRVLRIGQQGVRKVYNKLIQGSAASQTWAALVLAYRAGIIVKGVIHDSFEYSGDLETAEKLREIMETAVDLLIPSYVELNAGETWGDCK